MPEVDEKLYEGYQPKDDKGYGGNNSTLNPKDPPKNGSLKPVLSGNDQNSSDTKK